MKASDLSVSILIAVDNIDEEEEKDIVPILLEVSIVDDLPSSKAKK